MKKNTILAAGAAVITLSSAQGDVVHADDTIIQGSLAVGMDSVNNENFGFDTIRLKENNLRIKFEDTSSGTFPSNDWQLTANVSASGGANKFSIDDVTGSRTPFTVEAGTPTNSLYLDSTGKIGFGTSSPVLGLHQSVGDTPALRLDQNGSAGWTAQVWDIAGNESNFFVRDVTGGSLLPFRIKPGSPTNSLYIDTDGVGIGLINPTNKLHVKETLDAQVALIENTNGTSASRTVLELKNNGASGLRMSNTVATTGSSWDLTVTDAGALVIQKSGQTATYSYGGDGSFSITRPGSFGSTFTILSVDSGGNLTTGGTINGTSDVGRKENFGMIDTAEILDKVASIPLKTWSYQGESVTHVGPMAQDFYQAFELGESDRTISMADADGVALASIQALHKKSIEKDREISDLKTANSKLEERLQRLERMIESGN